MKFLLSLISLLPHLVCGQDPEGVDDLFGSVDVGGLARHEVEEAVELHVARRVGVDDGQNALEVDLPLPVLQKQFNCDDTQNKILIHGLYLYSSNLGYFNNDTKYMQGDTSGW